MVGLLGRVSTASSVPDATVRPSAATVKADLKASLTALAGVDVRKNGVDSLTSALADVATSLDAAVASATAELKPDLDAVKSALTALQSAAAGLTEDNFADKRSAIGAALAQLGTATAALASTVSKDCPTS